VATCLKAIIHDDSVIRVMLWKLRNWRRFIKKPTKDPIWRLTFLEKA